MSRILLVILVTTILDLQEKASAQCPFANYDFDDYMKFVQADIEEYMIDRRNSEINPQSCVVHPSSCDPKSPFRTIDESCNNLDHPTMGLPNSSYYRLLPAKYGDGIRSPRMATDGSPLPSARIVKTKLFSKKVEPPRHLNPLNVMVWGQIIAHDMSMLKMPETDAPCCSAEGKYVDGVGGSCHPIRVPPSDPTLGVDGIECLNFTRASTDKDLGCESANPAQQINRVTAFMDLSVVYGINTNMANKIRTLNGGMIKTVTKNKQVFLPNEANVNSLCVCNFARENSYYKIGDSRANENPEPAMLQMLFVREHNRLATELAKLNEHWDDERLFNEARRIVIGIFQSITYYEWMPMLLGREHMIDHELIYITPGYIDDYNSELNPNTGQEHSHAAYRFFHTHLVGETISMDSIRNHMYGIPDKSSESSPRVQGDDICDKVAACGKPHGLDLIRTTDFQRDRDHGLSYYNDYRKFCDLKVANTWEDLVDIPSEDVEILKTLYKSVDDLDLSVAGSLERFAEGALCGPTFRCIITNQFFRTRKGDRFYFENTSSGLSEDQLAQIKKVTAARLFCNNRDGIKQMPRNAFKAISQKNTLQDCSSIPSMDLRKWKEILSKK